MPGGKMRSGKCDADQVTAGTLRFIEQLVGFANDIDQFLIVIAVRATNAETRGDADALPFKREGKSGELFPEAGDGSFDALFPNMGKDHEEFIPTETATHVRPAGVFLQEIRKGFEDNVTSVVAKSVVDGLEAIDIANNNPEWEAMPG